MKFTCDKNVIVREISIAQEIISSKNALSILSNVLLQIENNSLLIRATDLKVGFETRIPVLVEDHGSTTVFCDKFLDIIKSLPEGDITFDQQGSDRLLIRPRDKDIDFQLKSIDSDKFPEIQDISDDSYFDIPQNLFNEMISQTIFAISDDETRYFMNGVYLENSDVHLVMVATDGRRLSYIKNTIEQNIPAFEGIIVPPKVLSLMRKLSSGEGNYSLAVSDKTIFLKFENQKLSSTLIEGQFPNYRRVIPEEQDYMATVEKSNFQEAIKRVSLLAEQKSRRVYFDMKPGTIVLRTEESEIGVAKEVIPCQYEGPEMTLALNYTYILDPLRVMNEKTLAIEFKNPNNAITLKTEPEHEYFHIIMPMQIE